MVGFPGQHARCLLAVAIAASWLGAAPLRAQSGPGAEAPAPALPAEAAPPAPEAPAPSAIAVFAPRAPAALRSVDGGVRIWLDPGAAARRRAGR